MARRAAAANPEPCRIERGTGAFPFDIAEVICVSPRPSALLALVACPTCAFAAPLQHLPLQYLTGASARAQPVVWLTWGVLLISIAVTVIIAGLLLAAVLRRHAPADPRTLMPDKGGLSWLWIGVSLSAAALLVTVVWTVVVLARIDQPGTAPRVTIEITGRQWWWQARYLAADPSQQFDTANEIHIPVGEPIRLKLIGGDVIHSFWVPQLAGKMDAIPGQVNETWIEASTPGTWTGQCTEYCGVQHAKMLLKVVAQTPADFAAWRAHQLAPATGQALFDKNCGNCHAVRGTEANGTFGPDLSHLMRRGTLASASLPNDPATLARWIADPQSLKPGNRMPKVKLNDSERGQVLDYLESLQ
jgi:cytochrome c oxidase subunit 2